VPGEHPFPAERPRSGEHPFPPSPDAGAW
jgi:hypothetical protein